MLGLRKFSKFIKQLQNQISFFRLFPFLSFDVTTDQYLLQGTIVADLSAVGGTGEIGG